MRHLRSLGYSRIRVAALCLALLLSLFPEQTAVAVGEVGSPVREYHVADERILARVLIPMRLPLAQVAREESPTPALASSPPPTPNRQGFSARRADEADSAWEDPRELRHWRLRTSLQQSTPPAVSAVATPPAIAPGAEPRLPKGKALVINQAAQQLQVFEDGVELRALPMSSGRYPLYTPAHQGYVGHYAPTLYGYGSLADHAWYLFKAGGNIYIHGAPYQLKDGSKVYEELEYIGVEAVSHGCIRLLPGDAEWLRDWNPVGAYFIVTPPNLGNN